MEKIKGPNQKKIELKDYQTAAIITNKFNGGGVYITSTRLSEVVLVFDFHIETSVDVYINDSYQFRISNVEKLFIDYKEVNIDEL